MTLTKQVREQIDGLVRGDRVVLFMKGTRQQPQCGFSATVVGILDDLIDDYPPHNVLADPALRALDAAALTEAAWAARFFPIGTIDGRVLPRQPVEVFDRGEQAPVPVQAASLEYVY